MGQGEKAIWKPKQHLFFTKLLTKLHIRCGNRKAHILTLPAAYDLRVSDILANNKNLKSPTTPKRSVRQTTKTYCHLDRSETQVDIKILGWSSKRTKLCSTAPRQVQIFPYRTIAMERLTALTVARLIYDWVPGKRLTVRVCCVRTVTVGLNG